MGRHKSDWRKKYFKRVTLPNADQEPNKYRRHLNICLLCGPQSKQLVDAPTFLRRHMRNRHAINVDLENENAHKSVSEQEFFSDNTNSDNFSDTNNEIVIEHIDHISADLDEADETANNISREAVISNGPSNGAAGQQVADVNGGIDPESSDSRQLPLSTRAMREAEHAARMMTIQLEQEKLRLEIEILNAKKKLLFQKMNHSSINITL
jgi:hypothetical protein